MAAADLPTFDDTWQRAQPHHPFFCEENVWQLLRGTALPRPAAAVFVSNDDRTVAMWGQRAVVEELVPALKQASLEIAASMKRLLRSKPTAPEAV